MFSKEQLCQIAGDDYRLIGDCPPKTRQRFRQIGQVVVVISFLCLVASGYSFSMLFNNWLIAGSLALFFAWMIFNFYRVILSTLSKSTLPHQPSRSYLLSYGIRILFLLLIATLVANSLEIMLLSNPISNDVAQYRQQLLNRFHRTTDAYYQRETQALQREIEAEQTLPLAGNRLNTLKIELARVIHKKEEADRQIKQLVDTTDFFAYRLSVLHQKYTWTWWITLCFWGLFLIPASLKLFMSKDDAYYQRKREVDYQLVTDEYRRFKIRYHYHFLERYGQPLHFTELYEDAPFNTRRKNTQYNEMPESSLLATIYDQS